MIPLVTAVVLLLGGGALALVAHRHERLATGAALAGLLGASAIGLPLAFAVVTRGATLSLRLPWNVPLGSLDLGLDPLSAYFLLPILVLAPLAGIYGAGYLREWRGRRNLGACWFLFNLLVACMVLVVAARNAVLFLVAWETMALASYGLVVFEDERDDVRRAGRTYLIATHLGTAALLVLFLLLGQPAGSLDFADLGPGAGSLTLLFVLAVIGFGTKAGFMPLHVWLPEAHPASPSHVSALMSGVMIKTGIYGLLRTLTFLGPPPPAWGWTMVGIGVSSGVLGVLFALAQHDIKRLLAYHSVENIGIIALGIGVGLLGRSYDLPAMAYLGFAGALLHVVNHALFKGLLFLGAGAVAQAAHTRDIDHLGGLLKRMPWTGAGFLVGSAAISGLPPFNGFVSEFLIFTGALTGIVKLAAAGAAAGAVVVGSLGLIGGLAAACFAKAFGIAFLGEPRSDHAADAVEAGWSMRAPIVALAVACLAIGMLGPVVVAGMDSVIAAAAGLPPGDTTGAALAAGPLRLIVLGATVLLVLIGALVLARRGLLAGRPVGTATTWDCGYAAPDRRMQYTAAGFAQPLTALFRFALRTRREGVPVRGLFPGHAALATSTPDPMQSEIYAPVFAGIGRLLAKRRWLQGGQTQLYVLYIVLTLVALLVWKLS
ncbi:MAG: proton-conducting transporter transmembrane domain-containing protein [Candidatus Krumholzibacteriia bacterium]